MKQINNNLAEKCGVYIITNIVNGKRYIGSSKNLKERLIRHKWELDKGIHVNNYLQNSWNKYGEDSFEYGILCLCDITSQFEFEQYYIDNINPEYNIQKDVLLSTKSEESKVKISAGVKNKYLNSPDVNRKYKEELYVYNILEWKLVKVGKLSELCSYFYNNSSSLKMSQIDNGIIKDKYVICSKKFSYIEELQNFVYENIIKYKTANGKLQYLIIEEPNKISYFRTTQKAVNYMQCSSASTLKKHSKNTKENPYNIPNTSYRMYMSDVYIPIKTKEAVPIEESLELSLGNIGEETTIVENTEINTESKESVSSYSIEDETQK